ncbi:uncharacterized protein METZ01_LOCUS414046, partial [marine metagenome]
MILIGWTYNKNYKGGGLKKMDLLSADWFIDAEIMIQGRQL